MRQKGMIAQAVAWIPDLLILGTLAAVCIAADILLSARQRQASARGRPKEA